MARNDTILQELLEHTVRQSETLSNHIKYDEKELSQRNELLTDLGQTVKESSRCLVKLDKKLDLHIQKTEFELNHIKETNVEQTDILNKRIERIKSVESRVGKLEEPIIAKKWLTKNYLIIGSVVTATLSFLALIAKMKGLW